MYENVKLGKVVHTVIQKQHKGTGSRKGTGQALTAAGFHCDSVCVCV